MNELALIRAAKHGDSHAAGRLVERCMPSCMHTVRDLFLPGHDHEDLEQEVRCAILNAIGSYDPGHGYRLVTLARVTARRWIITLITAEQRDRRRANHDAIHTLVDPETGEVDQAVDWLEDRRTLGPEQHLAWRQEVERLARGLTALSDLERRSIVGLANGCSYAEIDKPGRVDNALQRARQKLYEAA